MEQLRDTYASDSLVKLAKDLGFNGEPAHIDQANNKEDYTLAIIQKWLINRGVHVYCTPSTHFIDNDFEHYNFAILHETTHVTDDGSYNYDNALEAGLREACMILIEKENGYKVLE